MTLLFSSQNFEEQLIQRLIFYHHINEQMHMMKSI